MKEMIENDKDIWHFWEMGITCNRLQKGGEMLKSERKQFILTRKVLKEKFVSLETP